MREIGKDRLSHKRLTLQRGYDADAVKSLSFARRESKHFQQCRIEVAALDDRVAARVTFDDAGPDHYAGYTDTALEHSRLSTAQWPVACGRGAIDLVVHVPAIVGEEYHDRLLGDAQPIERVEQRADGIVHRFDHRSVSRTTLRVVWVDAIAMLLDQRRFRVKWSVNAEHPVVQKERFVLVLFQERNRFLGHAVFDVFVRRVRIEIGEFPRRHVASRRSRPGPVRHIHIEAMLQWRIRLVAKMPFAEMSGGIAGVLEGFGHCVVFGLQPRGRGWPNRFTVCRCPSAWCCFQRYLRQMTCRRGDTDASRAEAGKYARSRGRAERAGRVSSRERHPAPRQPFDVGRLVELRGSVQRRVAPPKIVSQDKDDVGLPFGGGPCRAER